MSILRHILFNIFLSLPVYTFSQSVATDSTHGFSKLIAKVYQARSADDLAGYHKLIHPYYGDKPITFNQGDTEAIRWGFSISVFPRMKVYDTVTVNDGNYCKVEYTLNCVRKMTDDQMDLLPQFNNFFGASRKLGQDGYFDQSTSTYRYYPNRWALMVLKKGDASWRMLEYNPKEVESWFGIEPREVFYAVEGIDGVGCKSINYTQEQLGKLVYESLVDYHQKSIYCSAGIQRKELIWASGKRGKPLTENDLYKTLIEKKKTIDQDLVRAHDEYPWKETKFSQTYSFVEKVNGLSFSAILVEFIYEGRFGYFEVESVRTPIGWRIIDDINMGSFRNENKVFIPELSLGKFSNGGH